MDTPEDDPPKISALVGARIRCSFSLDEKQRWYGRIKVIEDMVRKNQPFLVKVQIHSNSRQVPKAKHQEWWCRVESIFWSGASADRPILLVSLESVAEGR